MERKEFKILIDAPAKNVWDVLWGADTYPTWVSAFMEGSRVESVNPAEKDIWKKGNKVRFVGPDNEGTVSGMVSMIAENRPNEYLSIKHLGVVNKGEENYDTPWTGSLENYTLKATGNKTEVIVDMEITQEYLDYFENVWPKALAKVKELAEKEAIAAH